MYPDNRPSDRWTPKKNDENKKSLNGGEFRLTPPRVVVEFFEYSVWFKYLDDYSVWLCISLRTYLLRGESCPQERSKSFWGRQRDSFCVVWFVLELRISILED